jgi:hypothetical protein
VISKLLGKNVYAQGEKMKLEQWHLEVVDEFRGYVPGWEEAVVAKRVFALIVGEERRALGLIGGGTEDQAEVWGRFDEINWWMDVSLRCLQRKL